MNFFLFTFSLLFASTYQSFIKIFPDGTYFEVAPINDTYMSFIAEVSIDTYLGIGFGTSMTDCDMIIYQAHSSKTPEVIDYWSTGPSTPDVDSSQDYYNISVSKNSTFAYFYFERALDTGDSEDAVLSFEEDIDIVFAVHTSSSLKYHGNSYGEFIMNVPRDKEVKSGDTSGTSSIVFSDKKDMYVIHGWIMWAAWGVCGTLQIISLRYLKQFYKISYFIHLFSGYILLILTYALSFIIMEEMGWKIKKNLHCILGLLVLVVSALIVIGGLLSKGFEVKLKWNTKKMLNTKFVHKSIGYIMIIIGQVGIFTGVAEYTEDRSKKSRLHLIHVIVFVVILIILEILHRLFKKKKVQYKVVQEIISVEQFEQRVQKGEKLAILDDMVLDVKDYLIFHPGGKFVIEHNIGKDISKFFYGGYALENKNNKETHPHSNTAQKIINKLIIAYLEKKQNMITGQITDQNQINSNTSTVYFQINNIGQITDPNQVNPNTSVTQFPLNNTECDIRMYYSDINMIGKHFLLKSNTSDIKRHYTICNCLDQEIFQEYMKGLDQLLSNQNPNIDINQIKSKEQKQNTLILTIKNYKKPKGLSTKVHKFEKNAIYEIIGPMGKGLQIKPQGVHLAFSAGTGSLVFLDLAAYLLRQELNLLEQQEMNQLDLNEFKFIFFVSFQNRQDSIALDFLEKLHKYYKNKNNNKNFELVLRLSNESKERWNLEFIEKYVQRYDNEINRIWVCGPPLMNEDFDKNLNLLSQKYKFQMNQVEIM